ncbi:MAG: PepSY-associated TM helix domain-containing protein [Marinobacter sp.]|uniref:PepSY-associated TM helix domain-containing protein n=1 Tax=Marinobacter sp. TaxID=50741 RepID=UPI003F958D20
MTSNAEGYEGTQRAELSAATGERIRARETLGGNVLYRFHYQLHAIPKLWGRWIVGLATGFMLVALISGVIVHKKIFKDFFTFRPRKGQRSWLDAHNVTSVLALPFCFVIALSGLILLATELMPWGVNAAYDGDRQTYNAERRGLGTANNGSAATTGQGKDVRSQPVQLAPAPLTNMQPVLAEAERRWPERGVGTIVVNQPGTSQATIELREQGGDSMVNRGMGERLIFNGVSGELQQAPGIAAPPAAKAVYNVLTSAHMGRPRIPLLRWLLFFSGIVGTAMVATGMVLWIIKRSPKRKKLGYTPWTHRFVEVMNVGGIAGLSLATAAYFWLNRLIPGELAGRAEAEVYGFFTVWCLTFVYALVRPYRQAWREQMALAALMFVLLPVINPLTGGNGLVTAIAAGQWSVASFDLAMLLLAALHGLVAYKLRNHLSVAPSHRRTPNTQQQPRAEQVVTGGPL